MYLWEVNFRTQIEVVSTETLSRSRLWAETDEQGKKLNVDGYDRISSIDLTVSAKYINW